MTTPSETPRSDYAVLASQLYAHCLSRDFTLLGDLLYQGSKAIETLEADLTAARSAQERAERKLAAKCEAHERERQAWMNAHLEKGAELAAVREALKLAAKWIEEEEGRTLDEIIAIEDRQLEHTGKHAWNARFAAMCKAVKAALGGQHG